MVKGWAIPGLSRAVTFACALLCATTAGAASVIVTGSDGAAGANGLNSPPAAAATDGQPGGPGLGALAVTPVNGDASNYAGATGGRGGQGGSGGTSASGPGGLPGAGGDGGIAIAVATTHIAAGDAVATTAAQGGLGAIGGLYGDPGIPGAGGSASAQSTAVSEAGTATANAEGDGNSGGVNSSLVQGGAGNGFATADATASGDANAHAVARGGILGLPPVPPGAPVGNTVANATATSSLGNATAQADSSSGAYGTAIGTARAVATHGDASASVNIFGYSGTDTESAVSGSASGTLTLSQEVYGFGTRSSLEASNPGGGALLAHTTSHGGSGDVVSSISASSPTATSTSPVTVYALSLGDYRSGTSEAHSTLRGSREAELYTASNGVSSTGSARADSQLSYLTPGEVMGGAVSMHGAASQPSDIGSFASVASRGSALENTNPSGTGSSLVLDPRAEDVSAWFAGKPHAQAELAAGDQVLGLGSVGANSESTQSFGGSLELSFKSQNAQPVGVVLAFLDPTSVGAIDSLHLTFSRTGTILLERTFASAADLVTGLDDLLVPLGTQFTAGQDVTPITLSWDATLLGGGNQNSGFAFNVAFLSRVPEPSLAGLAGLGALFALGLSRRRARPL